MSFLISILQSKNKILHKKHLKIPSYLLLTKWPKFAAQPLIILHFRKGLHYMKLIQVLADIICNTLLDPKALDRARRREGAFTRNCGKLPYWTLVKLLLKNAKRTIASAVISYSEGRTQSMGRFFYRTKKQAYSVKTEWHLNFRT